MTYDIVVIGSGLFGAVVAHEAQKCGKRVLVVEKRGHVGGNCFSENVDGINVHTYGAHIFRTARRDVWDYVRQFAEFNHFVNAPVANYHGQMYNMPFNMNTFNRIWGVTTPAEVKAKIEEQRKEIVGEPRNLEEKAISLVGRDVYEILIREYTEKQWGRPCAELPASIIRRLPVRLVYDNNYFNDPYQGIPVGGYTQIFEKLLKGCEVKVGVEWREIAKEFGLKPGQNGNSLDGGCGAMGTSRPTIVYTGAIDEYFGHCYGPLEYRSLRFEHKRHDETDNLQGVAVVNYTDKSVPYTRTIEHKHFEFGCQPVTADPVTGEVRTRATNFTIVSKEYPFEWHPGVEPYYPINDAKNQARYEQYAALAEEERAKGAKVVFGGRLGSYRYADMQDTIIAALELAKKLWGIDRLGD